MKRIVTPGEVIASAEEFDVKGAAYMQDYNYLASATGIAIYEAKSHVSVVKPVKQPKLPTHGSVVYCQVVGKGRRGYQLRCFAVDGGKGPEELRYSFTGVVPYVFSDGELGIGDYVRGKVVSTYGPPLVVSIKGHTYGAVLSRCPKCGSVLKRRGAVLHCPSCGSEVKRKVAVGYYTV